MEKNGDTNYEQQLRERLYPTAKEMTLEALPPFLKKIKEENGGGYGTTCIALAAGAIATMWALDKSFGITGFQASCSLWEIIREWQYPTNKTGLRLVDYDTMLYPQYENNFQKVISKDTWCALRKEAKRLIEEENACKSVMSHWQSICDGRVPFGYLVSKN